MQAVTWIHSDIRPDVEARHERLCVCCVILMIGDVQRRRICKDGRQIRDQQRLARQETETVKGYEALFQADENVPELDINDCHTTL